MFEHLSEFLDIIINLPTKQSVKEDKIKSVIIANEIFHASVFETYEVKVLEKTYLIKKYKLLDNPCLPSGMISAYLNANNEFQSLGLLAVKDLDDLTNPLFISVEEETSYFITINNITALMNDEKQIIYFIYDFFNVFNALHHSKIKLMNYNIVIAVNNSNKERWRFRVDDIGEFYYFNEKTGFENNKIFMRILCRIILHAKNEKILEFSRKLICIGEIMCSLKDVRYFNALQTIIDEFKAENFEL